MVTLFSLICNRLYAIKIASKFRLARSNRYFHHYTNIYQLFAVQLHKHLQTNLMTFWVETNVATTGQPWRIANKLRTLPGIVTFQGCADGERHASQYFQFARIWSKGSPCCERVGHRVVRDIFVRNNSLSIGQNAPPQRRVSRHITTPPNGECLGTSLLPSRS